jgi:general secretion pathway protein D
MDKSYISALMVVLMAGARMAQAQESLDDVFAQLDAANGDATVVSTGAAAEMSELNALYRKGVALMRAGDFDQASLAFESMQAIDPYNKDAAAMLKRTAKYIASRETRKAATTRAAAMADVKAAWNQEAKKLFVDETDAGPVKSADDIAKEQMVARLKSIVIPSLDFRDANIEDVVMFLTETCRRLDPEGQGINLLLQGMNSTGSSGNVTISIRDMNLYEALGYITEMAELKFEVGPRVVSIMPVNFVPKGELITKAYVIIPEVGAEMEAMAGGDSGGIDDLFGDTTPVAAGPTDVAGFFSIVNFPEGAEAIYQPRFRKLFVKNTKANIKALEEVLNDLEQEAIRRRSQQVNIKAKFVEFNEGALEELGFDWTVKGSGSFANMELGNANAQYNSGLINRVPTANGEVYTTPIQGADMVAAGTQNLLGLGQRNNTTAYNAAIQTGLLANMGGITPAFNIVSDHFDLRISAMEQAGTADVLSAPQVTTKSGNEAIIRVVEVHRYPQDYDVETGQRTAPVVKPQDWEEEDLGVVLKVTPVVDAESNTIDLDMLPSIKNFRGYDDYIVGYNAYESGGNDSSELFGDGSTLYARMPYFETREVQTQVTVADGSTIAMGGLVSESTETFVDRVPFLGDIPYLGRLFRTEGSRSAKRNLMIFVTATQVDEKGRTRADREADRKAALAAE